MWRPELVMSRYIELSIYRPITSLNLSLLLLLHISIVMFAFIRHHFIYYLRSIESTIDFLPHSNLSWDAWLGLPEESCDHPVANEESFEHSLSFNKITWYQYYEYKKKLNGLKWRYWREARAENSTYVFCSDRTMYRRYKDPPRW